MIHGLETHFGEAEPNARVEWYLGWHRGFAHRSRVKAFDTLAAERHHERLLDLFDRTRRSGKSRVPESVAQPLAPVLRAFAQCPRGSEEPAATQTVRR